MFISISFKRSGLGLITHAEWQESEGKSHTWRLFICSTCRQVDELLCAGEIHEGHAVLTSLALDLPSVSYEPIVRLTEGVAEFLSSLFVALNDDKVSIPTEFLRPELSGFWESFRGGTPGPGILAWVDEDLSYRVAIVHSKQQASSLIRSMAKWMTWHRRESRLRKIQTWNMPPTSEEPVLEIGGESAELIHYASLWGNVWLSMGYEAC